MQDGTRSTIYKINNKNVDANRNNGSKTTLNIKINVDADGETTDYPVKPKAGGKSSRQFAQDSDQPQPLNQSCSRILKRKVPVAWSQGLILIQRHMT